MKIEFKTLDLKVKLLVHEVVTDPSGLSYWCDEVKTPPNRALPIRFKDGVSGWHVLSRRKLEKGTQLLANLFPAIFCKLLTEQSEQDKLRLADLLIQLSIFGEENYGRPE